VVAETVALFVTAWTSRGPICCQEAFNAGVLVRGGRCDAVTSRLKERRRNGTEVEIELATVLVMRNVLKVSVAFEALAWGAGAIDITMRPSASTTVYRQRCVTSQH
jgi:hypothetical protein